MDPIFRDFSFEPPTPSYARRPSWATEQDPADQSISPDSILCTPSSQWAKFAHQHSPDCSVGELTQKLNQQNLRVDIPTRRSSNGLLTPNSDDDTFLTKLPSRTKTLATIRTDSKALRMQREANTRMQSSASHVKDISKLVQRMIEEEDQCSVTLSKAPSPSPRVLTRALPPGLRTPTDDEGVDMDYNPSAMDDFDLSLPLTYRTYRTSGECPTRVMKSVKMRKRTGGGSRRKGQN